MPSPLKQYLQFPEPQEEEKPPAFDAYSWMKRQGASPGTTLKVPQRGPFEQIPLSSLKKGPGGADEAAAANTGQEGEPRGALGRLGTPTVPQGAMAQTYGTPTPQAAPEAPFKMPGLEALKNTGNPSMDEYINDAMKSWRASMDQKGPDLPAAPPQRAPLPQRPERPWTDVIPQLLAGAGNVFSAAGYHPQDYLGQVVGMQEGRRQQVYEDALREHANQQQGKEEDFRYQLEKAHILAQERSRQQGQYSPFLQAAIENKFLTGQKTPAQQLNQQQLDWARTMFKDKLNPKEINNLAETLKQQFPERGDAIDEAMREAVGVSKVDLKQRQRSVQELIPSGLPPEIQKGIEERTVPTGRGMFGRTPVLGAEKGIMGTGTGATNLLYATPLTAPFKGAYDLGDVISRNAANPVRLPAMTEEEQMKAVEELQKKMKAKRSMTGETQRYSP